MLFLRWIRPVAVLLLMGFAFPSLSIAQNTDAENVDFNNLAGEIQQTTADGIQNNIHFQYGSIPNPNTFNTNEANAFSENINHITDGSEESPLTVFYEEGAPPQLPATIKQNVKIQTIEIPKSLSQRIKNGWSKIYSVPTKTDWTMGFLFGAGRLGLYSWIFLATPELASWRAVLMAGMMGAVTFSLNTYQRTFSNFLEINFRSKNASVSEKALRTRARFRSITVDMVIDNLVNIASDFRNSVLQTSVGTAISNSVGSGYHAHRNRMLKKMNLFFLNNAYSLISIPISYFCKALETAARTKALYEIHFHQLIPFDFMTDITFKVRWPLLVNLVVVGSLWAGNKYAPDFMIARARALNNVWTKFTSKVATGVRFISNQFCGALLSGKTSKDADLMP